MKKLKSVLALLKKTKKIKPKGSLKEKAILLEAGQGKNINGNMFALLKSIEYENEWKDYIPYFVVTKNTMDAAKERCAFYQFKKVQFVIRESELYWELLNTCKYVMTDNSFPPLYTKQEGQIYLNTWHGTPLKYLGRSDIKNASSLGNVQKNYFMCDYALFPNYHTKDVFMKDYMVERGFAGTNVLADYPRNAALLDQKAAKELRHQLGLDGIKVAAYMPTWRGSNRSADSEGQVQIIKEKLQKIDDGLKENELLYVNLHFLVSSVLDFSDYKHIRPFPKEYETYDFLNICDVLITDYSSVFFDFAVTNKKIILFAYDKEDYLRDKGMYMDIHTFPFPIVETEEALLHEIHHDQVENRDDFQMQYCGYADQDIVNKILRLVLKQDVSTLTLEKVKDNGKKNCVYHIGNIGSYLTRELVNKLVNQIDLRKNNVTLCFEGGITPAKVELLKELPPEVYYYSLVKADSQLLLERIFMALFVRTGWFKTRVQTYLQREKKRLFNGWKPDEIHFYLFQKVKYAYIYDLFDCDKVFHHLPENCLGLKVFKNWYVQLLKYTKEHYLNVINYQEEDVKEVIANVGGYHSDVSFKITRFNTKQIQDGIVLSLGLSVVSYQNIDFSKYKIRVGNRDYLPQIQVSKRSSKGYNRWKVKASIIIPFEDSKGQELQNKVCFVDFDADKKMRITYGYVWKKLNRFRTLKIYIDEQRSLTYFFRFPKDSLTLTIRDKNVTDLRIERFKVVLAYLTSKILFFFKPVVFFEKNAARYEESASVVYESLMDRGYKNGYFILDKNYPFKDDIPEKYRSHVVDKYSFKHYVCFFSARSFIGSESKVHSFELRPISKLVLRKLNHSKHNYVFLQHGVMYMISLDAGRRTFFKKSKNKKVRQRTIVSSQLELEHFVELGGYSENNLYLCGLPKFDRNTLNAHPTKIAVMITWRPWEFIQSLDNIEETSYFQMLNRIVSCIPEEYHEHLLVLPHPLVEQQMRTTDNALKDFVPEVMKYDDILKDTKILITDYSSISYDAFYRGCNVIFCWQEKDACLVEYGANAKLMLTEDLAFGDVNYDYEKLTDIVRYNYTHPQQQKHLDRYGQVVNFHDGHNTDRLIDMLIKDKMI